RTWSDLPFSWSTTYGWAWSGHWPGEPTLDTIWNDPAVEQLTLSALSPERLTHELTAKLLLDLEESIQVTPTPASASTATAAMTTPMMRPRLLLVGGGPPGPPGASS